MIGIDYCPDGIKAGSAYDDVVCHGQVYHCELHLPPHVWLGPESERESHNSFRLNLLDLRESCEGRLDRPDEAGVDPYLLKGIESNEIHLGSGVYQCSLH